MVEPWETTGQDSTEDEFPQSVDIFPERKTASVDRVRQISVFIQHSVRYVPVLEQPIEQVPVAAHHLLISHSQRYDIRPQLGIVGRIRIVLVRT